MEYGSTLGATSCLALNLRLGLHPELRLSAALAAKTALQSGATHLPEDIRSCACSQLSSLEYDSFISARKNETMLPSIRVWISETTA